MSRKQKGARGKKITVQMLRGEDRKLRALADSMNQSVANAVRLILVAELDRREKLADSTVEREPVAASSAA